METSIKFSDCSQEYLEKSLGLVEVDEHLFLSQWLDKMPSTVIGAVA